MDEQESAGATPLVELIEEVLQGTASDGQKRELHARLLASAEDRRLYLHRLNLHSALRRQFAYDVEGETPAQTDVASSGRDSDSAPRGPTTRLAGWSWAAVAAAVVVLIAGAYLLRPSGEREIATITEMHGGLQWTGDGGRVVRDPRIGSSLRGGTLESLSADSWAVLTFRDGSTVTVSGQSMLTISEGQQKEMHLREGSVSASLARQPHGQPMLIHTPTARLEVLGTQLNVDVERTSTTLRVNEGRVRVTRLADGRVAEVPADHQVVVSASGLKNLEVGRRPDSVRSWQSSLPSGAAYGEWVPDGAGTTGTLRTAPMLLDFQTKRITLHVAAFSVSRGPAPPVLLTSGGTFRIRGQIETSGEIFFGLTTKHAKGGFAGKYVAARKLEVPPETDDALEIDLRIEEFHPQEEEFADSPIGLELVDLWCCTYNVDAGLSIASVELLPTTTSAIPQQPTTEPVQLPIMDIWAAAAQGNLKAVRRHLAAGAEIDATFIARGIPASGATPLHLAVLCDQGEIAQFLIRKEANLNAKAKDEHGGTPLHWAAALGRIEMARRLIDAGADVNARDNNGFTPLDATSYDPESEKKAKLTIAELLRNKGGKSAMEHQEKTGLQ
ncbi:MAG TPA: ankyrin repeat domain-containing protein [Phycisphaerae bacterium]|nr:ankyrin repeat domain-containing protein [Phycisphaerae bacterium]